MQLTANDLVSVLYQEDSCECVEVNQLIEF